MRASRLPFGRGAIVAAALGLTAGVLGADNASPPLHVKHGYGLKGLVLWLSADSGVTADAQGHVTKMTDKTGNFTLTPPNGQPGPLLVANILNGHPVLRFNGRQCLYSPDNFGAALDRDMTVIIVAINKARPNAEQFSLYLGQNTAPHYNRAMAQQHGKELFDGQFIGCYGEPVVRDAFVMTAASINLSRTQATFYRNGEQVMVAGHSLENPPGVFEQVSDGVTMGAAPPNLCGWNGDIAEELVYDRQLTAEEMKTLWTELATRYGLQNPAAAPANEATR